MTADTAALDSNADTVFRSTAAETGKPIDAAFAVHGASDVAAACAAAEAAFDRYRATTREARATFLERIADEILGLGDALIVAAIRTATRSFTDAVRTQVGGVFGIEAAPFTMPVRNALARAAPKPVTVKVL